MRKIVGVVVPSGVSSTRAIELVKGWCSNDVEWIVTTGNHTNGERAVNAFVPSMGIRSSFVTPPNPIEFLSTVNIVLFVSDGHRPTALEKTFLPAGKRLVIL